MIANALLTELATLLERFINTGEEGMIDLRSLPMNPNDKTELEEALGKGEVSANVDVVGLTKIWETSYAGIWWIRSFGAKEQIVYEQIVVTSVPELLKTHPDDMAASLSQLQQATLLNKNN